jgi:photosystem II stability/assembly factor-like uncharacterized protein
MKRLMFCLCTFILLFNSNLTSQTGWMTQNSSTTENLNGVSFVNNNTGYTVGNHGVMLKTTNEGLVWNQQNFASSYNLNDVYFMNADTGLVVGSVSAYNSFIAITTNGGLNWTIVHNISGVYLYKIDFINSTRGIVVGGASVAIGAVLMTTNGGWNWTEVNMGINNSFISAKFIDVNNIFITGGYPGGGGIVLKSTNGGTNWNTVLQIGQIIYDVSFGTPLIGNIVSQGGGYTPVRRSTNAGVDWFPQFIDIPRDMFSISSTDSLNSTMVGYQGYVYRTTNGGVNWLDQTIPPYNHLMNVEFIDINTGTAVGYNSRIIHTKTAGFGIPNPPVLNHPRNDSILSISNPFLGWYPSPGAQTYSLQLSTDSLFGTLLVDSSNIDRCVFNIQPNTLVQNVWHYWRVKSVNFMGSSNWSSVFRFMITILGSGIKGSDIPTYFSLLQNYPNPFNPSTKIKFNLPDPSEGGAITPLSLGEGLGVRLCIYDLLGREVATLVNEQLKPGMYEVEFNGTNYPSGVYFYKLSAGEYRDTKKMVLLK